MSQVAVQKCQIVKSIRELADSGFVLMLTHPMNTCHKSNWNVRRINSVLVQVFF